MEKDCQAHPYTGQILKRAGVTQEELAQRIGSNRGYISRIESGTTVPLVSNFFRLIEALGMSVEIIDKKD